MAEIAWRWSFGLAAAGLLLFTLLEFFDTLPVSNRDVWFLRSRHPLLIWQALARIFQGSGPRLVLAGLIVVPALAVAWVLLSSLGRGATLEGLVGNFRDAETGDTPCLPAKLRFGSLAGLNFLRLAATFAAIAGCLGAVLIGSSASPKSNPSPGAALLIVLTVGMMVGLAWSVLNWFLSLAAVFVVEGGEDTFGALACAVNLCRTRGGSVVAAGTWFGLAHVAAFFVAASAVGFPLAFAGLLPAGMVLGGVLLVALLYFAVTDFLYVGRMAAYVAILELPPPEPAPVPVAPPPAPSAGPLEEITPAPAEASPEPPPEIV